MRLTTPEAHAGFRIFTQLVEKVEVKHTLRRASNVDRRRGSNEAPCELFTQIHG